MRSTEMDRVQQLLAALCEDVETQVKSHLRGPVASLVQQYLPQRWVFETECGSCTIFLDTDGYARVYPGADQERDVTLKWRTEALESVLMSRSHDSVSAGDFPDVLVHTDKGRAAFNYLRKEIGL